MLLLGLEGVGFSDLYVLGGQLSRRVLGKSGFSFWAGTLFYVGILSAHAGAVVDNLLTFYLHHFRSYYCNNLH